MIPGLQPPAGPASCRSDRLEACPASARQEPGTKRRGPRTASAIWPWAAPSAVVLVVLAFLLPALLRDPLAHAGRDDTAAQRNCRTTPVVRGTFEQVVRQTGTLKPVNEQRILVKVGGTILEMAPQGKVVAKGEVVLQLDPRAHADARDTQEAGIKQLDAEFRKAQQEASKLMNQAKEDVAGYDLRVELETQRLEEIKRGPTPTDKVNAQVSVESNRILLKAREDEFGVLEGLTKDGYASREELRQKEMDVKEQRLSASGADVKDRKLDVIDPVRLAQQEFKVHEAMKLRDAAKERVALLERNKQRDQEHHDRQMAREKDRLEDLTENVAKTSHAAPGPGVVVHRRHRWFTYSPGRDVWEGQEVLALPDFTQMKVALTVDEAQIAKVSAGQEAAVTPAGWNGAPFKGKVSKVADKGRDEFEMFSDETTSLCGTANRQVFDVEVDIEEDHPILRPGLRADVQIVIRTLDGVLLAPRTALLRDKDGSNIVQVDGPNGIERRPVKIVAESDFTAVVEGVKAGESIWVVEP